MLEVCCYFTSVWWKPLAHIIIATIIYHRCSCFSFIASSAELRICLHNFKLTRTLSNCWPTARSWFAVVTSETGNGALTPFFLGILKHYWKMYFHRLQIFLCIVLGQVLQLALSDRILRILFLKLFCFYLAYFAFIQLLATNNFIKLHKFTAKGHSVKVIN